MKISAIEVARAFGGSVIGPGRVLVPGPGHSKRDRSLEILLKPDAPSGFLCRSFAGDDDLHCKDYVRQVLGLPPWEPRQRTTPPQPAQKPEPDDNQRNRIAHAALIWRQTADPRGTNVECYLRSRGLALDAALVDVIRFHPRYGMVALLRDVLSDAPCGVHRTYLDGDGRKVDRKMLGRAKGAAIKLDSSEQVVTALCIGEGLETCLTAREANYRPVWALGSAGAVAAFPVLAGIEAITALAEHDDNGTNRRAIEQCARNYLAAGAEVWIIDPPCGDLNDLRRGL
jgi:Toprim domain